MKINNFLFSILTATVLAIGAVGVNAGADPTCPQQLADAPINTDFVYFVTVKIKPDQIAAYKTLYAPYAEQTQSEPGCVNYFVHQSSNDPTEFAIYEHWQSDAARSTHMNADYTQNFFKATAPMIAVGPLGHDTKYMELRPDCATALK